MHNNNLRNSSHIQLKTLQNQVQSTPVLKSIEQLKTEGIQYYYHQGNERKALHKIFTLNTKKRHIQRYINQQVYNADLNGISLKTSQIDRFNLYQKGLTDELQANSKNYSNLSHLKKADFQASSTQQIYGFKNSHHRNIRIISGQRIQSIQQENNQINQNRIQIQKHQVRPKREEQLIQSKRKDNLFTIVYNSKPSDVLNALNAQQIYWEIIKLKKYFRTKTIFGEEKKAKIIIHRMQLPNKYRTHDMSIFIEQHQETQYMFYQIAIRLFSFSIMHFYAKILNDDDTRYWVSIRFPNHMKQFDIFNTQIQYQYDIVFEKLQLRNKDLSGAVGYHNLKQGIKDLFKRERQIIDFETTDKSVEGLDNFLQQQDKKVLKSIK